MTMKLQSEYWYGVAASKYARSGIKGSELIMLPTWGMSPTWILMGSSTLGWVGF